MKLPKGDILTINDGSSSIKLAVFAARDVPRQEWPGQEWPDREWPGQLDRIGQPGTSLTITNHQQNIANAPSSRLISAALPSASSQRMRSR